MFDNIRIQGEALASKIYLSPRVELFAIHSKVVSMLLIICLLLLSFSSVCV